MRSFGLRWAAAAAGLSLLGACGKAPPPDPATGTWVRLKGRAVEIRAILDTERERRHGTLRLPRVDEHEGHLLAWPWPRFFKLETARAPASFDAAFLDGAGKIVDHQPFLKGDPEGIVPRVEAAYALLLRPGLLARLGAAAGDEVEFSAALRSVAPEELPAVRIGDAVAYVELSVTAAERNHGLMFRPRMSEDDGMLFAYPSEAPRSFWMGNTLIPLDIAFFRADGTLLNVNPTPIYPDPRHPPASYVPSSSDGPAQYVLEMNLGWFRKKGLLDEAGRPLPGLRAELPHEALRAHGRAQE